MGEELAKDRKVACDDGFVQRLNAIFDRALTTVNEPSFLTPFLYNYVPGHQYQSVIRSRQSVTQFHGGNNGLPGNSDGGALEAHIMVCFIVCGFRKSSK